MKILISACLMGENCKYNGGNNQNVELLELLKGHLLYPVCPEVMGGLSVPRAASEICGNRVMTKTGVDVTKAFEKGALDCLRVASEVLPDLCILKSRSPSCGIGMVYDGSFCGKLVQRSGVSASLLLEHGFLVFSEEDLGAIEKCLGKSDIVDYNE